MNSIHTLLPNKKRNILNILQSDNFRFNVFVTKSMVYFPFKHITICFLSNKNVAKL